MLILCWLFFGLFVVLLEVVIALAVPERDLFRRPLPPLRLRFGHLTIVIALIGLDFGVLGPYTEKTLEMWREVAFAGDTLFLLSVFALRFHRRVTLIGWLVSAYLLAIFYMILLVNVEPMLR